jgi:molybdenum-dependent DNA-binding transcriptional regulator ModE
VTSVPIADAVGQMKAVDPKGGLVAAARAIGISFGD